MLFYVRAGNSRMTNLKVCKHCKYHRKFEDGVFPITYYVCLIRGPEWEIMLAKNDRRPIMPKGIQYGYPPPEGCPFVLEQTI